MIFETERLLIRKLSLDDLYPFHELESNPLVLKYATGEVKTLRENKKELKELISKYDNIANDFWIYAVEKKLNHKFIGTVALVKDEKDDEIGYRFLEKYWRLGFASEVCEGLINYCKYLGIPKLVANVVDENFASSKILDRFNFKVVKHFISEDVRLPETKYELFL